MAEINIKGDYCTTLVQLQAYFREEIAYGSEVFLDLLDYGRRGDIAEWLRENGEGALAKDVDGIAPSVGDAEYIVCLAQALTGNTSVGGDNLPVKPAFEDCLELLSIDSEKFGDKTQIYIAIKIAIKVIKPVNETYDLKLVTGWGTSRKSLTPHDYRQGETIEWEVTYQNRMDVELGEMQFLADGRLVHSIASIAAPSEPVQKPAEEFTVGGVTFKMIRVEGGTFTMGATPEQEDPYDDEKPAHKVTLTKAYYLGESPVTQGLWLAVMGDNPSYFGKSHGAYGNEWASFPVEQVSWEDCQKFINKLNERTGNRFRLPTEAEWEFGARGGIKSEGYKYSGSNTIYEVAWFDGNSEGQTHPVKKLKPNELGLYDMSGNVWEWCQDWKGVYISSGQTDPKGPSSGTYRVPRGGSWFNNAWLCRSSLRGNGTPGYRRYNLGLRLCLSELRTEGDDEWMLS